MYDSLGKSSFVDVQLSMIKREFLLDQCNGIIAWLTVILAWGNLLLVLWLLHVYGQMHI